MRLNSRLKMAGVFIAVTLCGAGHAQSMYRCGSVYQDRPCEGKDPGKRIGSAGSPQSADKPVSDTECAQRGAETLKIVWKREAGASADKQIADLNAGRAGSSKLFDERKLIADVYNKRGSAPEVRAAIEADCMLEKERAAQAAAWAAAMPQPGQSKPGAGAATPGNSEADAKAANARRHEEAASRDAENKKARCADYKATLEDVTNAQRRGGGVSEMERLNQKRRDTDNLGRAAGC